MDSYLDYRIRIRLLSSTGTPWQADTLTGHLIYLVAVKKGTTAVKAFLEPFIQGDPPFVFSDAFPSGLLPKPLRGLDKGATDSPAEYALLKMRRRAAFLKSEDFDLVRKGNAPEGDPVPTPWESVETLHATIDRKTWTTGGEGGNLFATWSYAMKAPFNELDLYVRARPGEEESVLDLINELSQSGFGRDKTTGHGQFLVLGMEPWEDFSIFEGANGFVSLSTFVPAVSDPTEGQWGLNVKYGKLGEGVSTDNPFKRPLIQLVPGSVFRATGSIAPVYGRVISNIAPAMPEAVQVCYALSVPCVYPED